MRRDAKIVYAKIHDFRCASKNRKSFLIGALLLAAKLKFVGISTAKYSAGYIRHIVSCFKIQNNARFASNRTIEEIEKSLGS